MTWRGGVRGEEVRGEMVLGLRRRSEGRSCKGRVRGREGERCSVEYVISLCNAG